MSRGGNPRVQHQHGGHETGQELCNLTSYERGGGKPLGCDTDEQNVGGLCYPPCPKDYRNHKDQQRCYGSCPDDYRDDGLLCTRDVKIVKANTSKCPDYDKCGLTIKKGCSKCPDGDYKKDGCTCRRDASTKPKPSVKRPTGRPISDCPDGRDKDGALCYPKCIKGYKGVADRCWKS